MVYVNAYIHYDGHGCIQRHTYIYNNKMLSSIIKRVSIGIREGHITKNWRSLLAQFSIVLNLPLFLPCQKKRCYIPTVSPHRTSGRAMSEIPLFKKEAGSQQKHISNNLNPPYHTTPRNPTKWDNHVMRAMCSQNTNNAPLARHRGNHRVIIWQFGST
jgi:hypothetical protein